MRAFLALLLVIVVVGLTTVDPLVCADGCPDQATSHGPESSAPQADCLICHGWGPTTIAPTSTPAVQVAVAQPQVVAAPAAPYRRSIEHPPRLA